MKIIKHICIIGIASFFILGFPLLRSGVFGGGNGGTDAVSSASVVIDEPSGKYYIFINRDRHTPDKLKDWTLFFSGKEVSYIFEDISCMVAESDAGGLTMAQSFMSRLPQNQMTIRKEDVTLMLSKAEYGHYDIIIMSKEMCDLYKGTSLAEKTDSEMIIVEKNTETGAQEDAK